MLTFKRGNVAKALTKCPGGKVEIKLIDGAAQLSDSKTGKRIGGLLTHDRAEFNATKSIITLWAFSPDGKLVATGSRCQPKEMTDWSEGQICVWEVATGVRIVDFRGGKQQEERIGDVEGLAFSEDGKTVLFRAGTIGKDGM